MIDPDHARFAEWDAAYVLGALSPAERREFEEHLDECEKCRIAVTELSALPGLLGRIDDARAFALLEQGDSEGSEADAPLAGPPADLVARIENRARTDRIRRRFGMGASLAAAAAVAAVLALVLPPLLTPAPQPTLAASLVPSSSSVPVKATIELTSLVWGTRIDMDCTYDPAALPQDAGYTGSVQYAMWVVDRNGVETPLSTWTAAPEGTVSVSAGTALALADIAEVEVRTALGDQVLLTAELDAT